MPHFKKVIRQMTPAKFNTLKRRVRKELRVRIRPNPDRSHPLFVVGSGRSGTTNMVDILGRSLDTAIYSEGHPAAFNNFRLKPLDAIAELIEYCRFKVIVFKPIQDSHRIKELLQRFPNSKAIWIYRSFGDVVNSTIRKWGAWDKGIHDLELLKKGEGRWSEKISDDTLSFFKENYTPNTSIQDSVCLIWYMRNIQFVEFELSSEPRVKLVNYEKLVTSPERGFSDVFSFAGCEFNPLYVKDVYSTSISKRPVPQIHPKIKQRCEALNNQLTGTIENQGG